MEKAKAEALRLREEEIARKEREAKIAEEAKARAEAAAQARIIQEREDAERRHRELMAAELVPALMGRQARSE